MSDSDREQGRVDSSTHSYHMDKDKSRPRVIRGEVGKIIRDGEAHERCQITVRTVAQGIKSGRKRHEGTLYRLGGEIEKMGLIIKEIQLAINECEEKKKTLLREADRMREERKTYEHIKHLLNVIEEGEGECLMKV